MTLLIALLIMNYMGVTDPGAYVGVVLLWGVHLLYYSGRSRHRGGRSR